MRPPPALNFSLLRDLQGVIDLDTKISECTLQIGMPKQRLNGPEVLGSLVDQRRFRPSHCMRAVGRQVKSGCGNPMMHDPGVLPSLNMRRTYNTTGEKVLLGPQMSLFDPRRNCSLGRLG